MVNQPSRTVNAAPWQSTCDVQARRHGGAQGCQRHRSVRAGLRRQLTVSMKSIFGEAGPWKVTWLSTIEAGSSPAPRLKVTPATVDPVNDSVVQSPGAYVPALSYTERQPPMTELMNVWSDRSSCPSYLTRSRRRRSRRSARLT